MIISPIKTHKITKKDTDIIKIIDKYVGNLEENSILAITSKIVAITQGRILPMKSVNKHDLVVKEAELYLPPEENKYNIMLTIKNNLLIPTAGIDESNGNGYYILWPEDTQNTANQIRIHLQKRFNKKHIGVIITDSKTTPLRWGVTGATIAHSGFKALVDLRKTNDIFGRTLKITQINVNDALGAAAVYVMGEGKEQTPFAVIKDIPHITFQNRNPSQTELLDLKIDLETDLYSSILTRAPWKKGGKKKK